MNRAARRGATAVARRALRGVGWGEWYGLTPAELATHAARHRIARECTRAWRNHRFVVLEFVLPTEWGEVVHLHVHPVNQDSPPRWFELQRVKDELLGPERLAVEVYPPDEQLVDEANAYHLWVLPEGFELPFGLHRPGRGYWT